MTPNRVAALRAERDLLLETCRGLTHQQWAAPSRAEGWSVQDVVAHMGAGCHAIFTVGALKILRSKDIEQSNDMLVEQRRQLDSLTPPSSDPNTLAVVLEWMLAVLANQLKAARHPWLNAPIRIHLAGPGGGSWTVQPDATITTQPGAAAAEITASAVEFPEWSTRRVDWRQRDVTVNGDTGYASKFLDAVNIV